MMNYQEMSNEQIECAVSDALGIPRGDTWCSDWAETGAIIQEYLISITPRCANGEWKASIYLGREDIFDEYASSWDKNPLRAAMIVFLMMKGGE